MSDSITPPTIDHGALSTLSRAISLPARSAWIIDFTKTPNAVFSASGVLPLALIPGRPLCAIAVKGFPNDVRGLVVSLAPWRPVFAEALSKPMPTGRLMFERGVLPSSKCGSYVPDNGLLVGLVHDDWRPVLGLAWIINWPLLFRAIAEIGPSRRTSVFPKWVIAKALSHFHPNTASNASGVAACPDDFQPAAAPAPVPPANCRAWSIHT